MNAMLSNHSPVPSIVGDSIEGPHSDGRLDERAVRVLLVEDRPHFARIVCWALNRATRGRFQIEQSHVLAQAMRRLQQELFDAILVDLGERVGEEAEQALESAEALSHLMPVIVLTGTHVLLPAMATQPDELADLVEREHFDCDRLPRTILDAIKRHRRVGQAGADPIIYRLHD